MQGRLSTKLGIDLNKVFDRCLPSLLFLPLLSLLPGELEQELDIELMSRS
jgi:hypothetical protein